MFMSANMEPHMMWIKNETDQDVCFVIHPFFMIKRGNVNEI